jgi:hypothetical protein
MASHYIALVSAGDAQTSILDKNGTGSGVVFGTSSDATAFMELRILDGVVNSNSVAINRSVIVQGIEKLKDILLQFPNKIPY